MVLTPCQFYPDFWYSSYVALGRLWLNLFLCLHLGIERCGLQGCVQGFIYYACCQDVAWLRRSKFLTSCSSELLVTSSRSLFYFVTQLFNAKYDAARNSNMLFLSVLPHSGRIASANRSFVCRTTKPHVNSRV